MLKEHDLYAFPDDIGIEAAMRFASIRRWHMLDLTRVQTLAEHSANVALLAYVITITGPDMFFGPAAVVATHALLHDVGEVFTGDMPTPTKKNFRQSMDELERSVTPKFLIRNTEQHVRLLIKVCDIADGIRFLLQHGGGAIHNHAISGLRSQLHQKFSQMAQEWPGHVYSHVIDKVCLYAFETRDGITVPAGQTDERQMVLDLARGPGDIPRGTGRELRDFAPWTRNRVVGTEGSDPIKAGCTD